MMNEECARDNLLLCLRDNPHESASGVLEKLSSQEWNDIVALSYRHGVAPVLYQRLKTLPAAIRTPVETLGSLRRTYIYSCARNVRLFRDLGQVVSDLQRAGIPIIILKGAHLAENIYHDIALRPMSDIDLLVQSGDVPKASETLISLGYSGTQRASACAIHLDPFTKPGHVDIEVHHHIVDPVQMKHVDLAGLWQRAQSIRAGGVDTLALSPEDLLLQLCLHIAIHHGFSTDLCHLYDIRQMIESCSEKIDWCVARDRSRAWDADRSVYLILSLTDKLLGLNLPEGFLPSLAPECPDFDFLGLSQKLIFYPGSCIPGPLARQWGECGTFDKARILKRIFPAKEEMAHKYPVRENSLKIYFYYPMRIKQLMTRYLASIWRILTYDEETTSALKIEGQRNKLIAWLLSPR